MVISRREQKPGRIHGFLMVLESGKSLPLPGLGIIATRARRRTVTALFRSSLIPYRMVAVS